jgi:hypothetical protein
MDIPNHKSPTCLLYIAVDHGNDNQKVALKLMAIKVIFLFLIGINFI